MSSRPSRLRNLARQISGRVRNSASRRNFRRRIGQVLANLTWDLILLQLFTGIALGSVLVEVVRILFGTTGYPFDTPEILQGAVDIWVGYFPLYRLFVIGVTMAILIALWVFLERTNFGLIIRAGARDPQIVRILGID